MSVDLSGDPLLLSLWRYKDSTYRVLRVNHRIRTQDELGNWVGTVFYELESQPGLQFARPITEFKSKFKRVS